MKISPRTMSVLGYLADRAGEAVTHEELLAAFWPGTVASTNAVHKCMAELRHTFTNGGAEPTYIETVPKRGYRLIAAVRQCENPATIPIAPAPCDASLDETTVRTRQDSNNRRRRVVGGLVAALLLAVAAAWFIRDVDSAEARVIRLGDHSVALLASDVRSRSKSDARLLDAILDGVVAGAVARGATANFSAPPFGFRRRANDASTWGVDYAVEVDLGADGESLRGCLEIISAALQLPAQREQFEQTSPDRSSLNETMVAAATEDVSVLTDAAQFDRMVESGTHNLHAYRLARRAESSAGIATVESLEQAAELFRRAIREDPNFASAYASLASVYWTIASAPRDSAAREEARRKLQVLARDARMALADATVVAKIDHQYRAVSAGSARDAEALWHDVLVRQPTDMEALRRYADLMIGAKLPAEGEQYLQRAVAFAKAQGRQDVVDAIRPQFAGALELRGDWNGSIRLNRWTVEHFRDFTSSLYALVLGLAKNGRYAEAEIYLARLESTDPGWARSAEILLRVRRGDIRTHSAALTDVLADPQITNTTRGSVCFMLGDIVCGVRYWRDMEPDRLAIMWQFTPVLEQFWAAHVVEDPRYQDLLEQLGIGREWRKYMRARAAELTPITGIAVTSPVPKEDLRS